MAAESVKISHLLNILKPAHLVTSLFIIAVDPRKILKGGKHDLNFKCEFIER